MIRSLTLRRVAMLLSLAALPVSARAASQGQALVVGEAAYTGFPALQSCALSGHSVAAALRRLGFAVDEQEDASSAAIFAGISALARKLKAEPAAPAFVYVCSYATAYDGRSFLLPTSADLTRPADVLTQGLLTGSLVDAVSGSTKAPAMIALDAVPPPNAPADLGLARLTGALPPTVGLLAVRGAGANSQPTQFAALLAPALAGPTVQSAALLADLQQQLAGAKATVAALHMPADNLYLTPAPEPAPAPRAKAAPAVAAPPPAARTAPAPVELPPQIGAGLPDEADMSDDQRRAVQGALAKLGYYDGKVDGIFGAETRAAIRRWQHEKHVAMTGHLTAKEATQLVGG